MTRSRHRSRAERIYGALLVVYPAAFRAAHGEEMARLAGELDADRLRRGESAARFWLRLLADLAGTAISARAAAARAAAHRYSDPSAHLDYAGDGDVMDTLLQDIRYAVRTLRARPAVTFVAVLTLALGIGANTAIYSVVNAVLFRPLPYPAADRLAMIFTSTTSSKQGPVDYPTFLDWRDRSRSLEGLAIARPISVNLTGTDAPDRLVGNFVSASFFPLFGAHAALGRLFTDAETTVAGAQPVAVLSYEVWKTRFGGERSVLGRTIVLNAKPMTVIGVAEAKFQAPFGSAEVYLPVPLYNRSGLERGNGSMFAFGRLKPGVTVDAARIEMRALAKQSEQEYPKTNAGVGADLMPLHEQLVGQIKPALVTLLAAVGVVLVIACFNVANLQLARAAARRTEMSVRAALGASRRRLVRQLLTESVMISVVGGALGLVIATLSMKILTAAIPSNVQLFAPLAIDGRVLTFAFVITVATGLLFGLAPAVQSSRTNLHDVLRVRGARGGSLFGRVALRDVFVVAQIALSMVLLVSAGLLARSLISLQHVRPGFDPENVLTMEFRLPPAKYSTPQQISDFMQHALAEMRRVPGVTSVSMVRAVPFSGNFGATPYEVEGRPALRPADAPSTQVNAAADGYFTTMRIPLVAGRDFDSRDARDGTPVVIVNQTLAGKEWPTSSPLGGRVRAVGDSVWRTVVGVVGDVKHGSVADTPEPQIYTAYAQDVSTFSTVAARVSHDALTFGPALRAAIWSVDRDQPVWKIRTIEFLMERNLGQSRFTVKLVAAFAVLALVLAGVGIYGVMSYAVSQRTQEVGIRMALGARGIEVVRMIVGRGIMLALVAVALGVVTALAATRVLSAQLFGVSHSDPLTFGTVAVILASVAAIAAYVPARRAARVDPMVALRHE
ncbi:MAG: ABC transporter permease [Gemmatimonadaceae bacterium]